MNERFAHAVANLAGLFVSMRPRGVSRRAFRRNATAAVMLAYAVGCKPTGGEPPAQPDAGHLAARPSAAPNSLPIPAASVEAVLNPQKLPPYDGPAGSVEGTIALDGPSAPDVPIDAHACPGAIDVYGKLFRAASPDARGHRPLADALVVITGYTGYYLPDRSEAERVTIEPNCGYSKRTIAMTFGQRLEVSNTSNVPFAPRLDGVVQPAVMIAPPGNNGDPVKLYPPAAGHFVLGDTLQPFVREDVFVLRQPLHAVTDLQGHYRIDAVPVGKLRVSTLLPPTGEVIEGQVDVRANVVETVDLVITHGASDAGATTGPREHIIP
jgi:hypothetical protein